jgi:uncharacterized spore protein YtfJ
MVAVPDMLRSLGDRLQMSANARVVYGEPVTVGRRTVIPIARTGYGFGGGTKSEKEGAAGASPERVGGGGGVGARPIGAIEITESGTRFIPFVDPVRLVTMLALAMLAGFALSRRMMR